MHEWKDGSMEGQNIKMKDRGTRMEGQEDKQMMDMQANSWRKKTAESMVLRQNCCRDLRPVKRKTG